MRRNTPVSAVSFVLAGLAALRGARAQITSNATCQPSFDFFFNSRGQSPCLVAAYLGGACNGGQYDVSALLPNQHYIGPTPAVADNCQCSTVMYSMMAACSTCQAASVVSWSSWTAACPEVFSQLFPRNIPPGTAVPAWAYQDVAGADTFSPAAAQDDDAPESTASTQATRTGTGGPSPTGSAGGGGGGGGGGSNVGAIVGGVVGGVVALAALALGAWFFLRRRKRARAQFGPASLPSGPPSASTNAYGGAGHMSQADAASASPLMGRNAGYDPGPLAAPGPYAPTPVSAYGPGVAGLGAGAGGGRLYDPNDPATFPATPPPGPAHGAFPGAGAGAYGGVQNASPYPRPPSSGQGHSFQSAGSARPLSPGAYGGAQGGYRGAPEV